MRRESVRVSERKGRGFNRLTTKHDAQSTPRLFSPLCVSRSSLNMRPRSLNQVFQEEAVDGKGPAGNGEEGGRARFEDRLKVRGEELGVDGGRHEKDLEVGTSVGGDEVPNVGEEEVDVDGPLVDLVDDQNVDVGEGRIGGEHGVHDAGGAERDGGVLGGGVLAPDYVAGEPGVVELGGDSGADGRCGEPPRLAADDSSLDLLGAEVPENELGNLGGLAAPGSAVDDGQLRGEGGRDDERGVSVAGEDLLVGGVGGFGGGIGKGGEDAGRRRRVLF